MVYSSKRIAENNTGVTKVVPFPCGVFGYEYTNYREFVDRMTIEERYEAEIRSDFRTRPTQVTALFDSVEVVRL